MFNTSDTIIKVCSTKTNKTKSNITKTKIESYITKTKLESYITKTKTVYEDYIGNCYKRVCVLFTIQQ
jgi:hypothetical protein